MENTSSNGPSDFNQDEYIKEQKKKSEEYSVHKGLGDFFEKAKESFPELLEFSEKLGKQEDVSGVWLKDVDFQKKIAIFLANKLSRGDAGTGGVGYSSRVIVYNNGKDQYEDFQYRDRFTEERDNEKYNFTDLSIDNINEDNDKQNISVAAKPKDTKYGDTKINFSFDKKEIVAREKLSTKDQEDFEIQIEKDVQELLAEKQKNIEGKVTKNNTGNDFIPWEGPQKKNFVVDVEHGIGAVTIIETISYNSVAGNELYGPTENWMPQKRCELYIVEYGQKPKMIAEDHAYIVDFTKIKTEVAQTILKNTSDYGDPTISGIEIKGNNIKYSTREGQKEYSIVDKEKK